MFAQYFYLNGKEIEFSFSFFSIGDTQCLCTVKAEGITPLIMGKTGKGHWTIISKSTLNIGSLEPEFNKAITNHRLHLQESVA